MRSARVGYSGVRRAGGLTACLQDRDWRNIMKIGTYTLLWRYTVAKNVWVNSPALERSDLIIVHFVNNSEQVAPMAQLSFVYPATVLCLASKPLDELLTHIPPVNHRGRPKPQQHTYTPEQHYHSKRWMVGTEMVVVNNVRMD